MRQRFAAALILGVATPPGLAVAQPRHVAIAVDRRDSIAAFDPVVALGSTIDGHDAGGTRDIFTAHNVRAMKSANFHSISYRLRTELGVEAWHWNPRGSWSDVAHRQGYWTSDSHPGAPINVSNGYSLPRRGNTIDQANDAGYSRLTDGDTSTFWKSNPYLDAFFTHEPADRHPQWVIIDLRSPREVNTIVIRWGLPYATRYDVQYWPGEQPKGPDDNVENEQWRNFDNGSQNEPGHGGDRRIPLTARSVRTRWIRILLHSSSHTAPHGSRDRRDALGYAIRELELYGTLDGHAVEITRHGRTTETQTVTYASSTDPWHRSTDIDRDTEQPGIDMIFAGGMTRGLPMLTPVGVLYDTPANAASLLRYIRARRYAVSRIELGEEPDGQFVAPDDFAGLYMQAADSLHAADPSVALGGPSFQDSRTKVMMAWKDGAADERSWFAHFVAALTARGRMRDLAFVSFEFYPFDDACGATAAQLAQVRQKIRATVRQFHADGAPVSLPLLMTEYGYSPFSTAAEMDRAGAILNTEAVAEFLQEGGAETFLYGTEPSTLERNATCDSWGDNTLFVADEQRHIIAKNATYHAARMLTTLWADSAGGDHTMLRTRVSDTAVSAEADAVAAYSVRRPDGRVAVLAINRDPARAAIATLSGLQGDSVDVWTFSAAEYQWHAAGAKGFARPNRGPQMALASSSAGIELPPYSITVIRDR
ncbi:MAG: discoidin domain-containing protein [Gemmatimonadota bacterium]|nr:discoidin domain-containing protein [Gemmatimonadota bacterium]